MARKLPLYTPFILLLLGELVLGIAHLAALPPWEGFDETAHYSYLQQLADTWTLPRYEAARLSQDVEEYATYAPWPYASLPPMDQNGGLTYKAFFASAPQTIKEGKRRVFDPPPQARSFKAGTHLNWQAQHPPLYYLLLSPIYTATRHLGWAPQLFILRLFSYLLAWSALVLGLWSCSRGIGLDPQSRAPRSAYPLMLGLALWPLLCPSWFPEMARMGNDSLSALIVAILWIVSLRVLRTGSFGRGQAIALGLLLGLGCLTKAFFIPLTAGMTLFFCFRQWRERGRRDVLPFAINLGSMLVVAAAISVWWYAYAWSRYGSLFSSVEMVQVNEAGGLRNGLLHHFSISAWLWGHGSFLTNFAWSSTWSLARPSYLLLLPLLAFILAIMLGCYGLTLRHFRATSAAWLPVWMLIPVLAGFSYHVLLRVALTGSGLGTPGYYLHFMAVPLGIGLGLTLERFWPRPAFKVIFSSAILYGLTFLGVLFWVQILLFAGVAFKAGENKFYQFPHPLPPFWGLPEAIRSLNTLAYPASAVFTYLLGILLIGLGLFYAWRGYAARPVTASLPEQLPAPGMASR